MDQTKLLDNIADFITKSKPRSKEDWHKKQDTFDSVCALFEDPELTLPNRHKTSWGSTLKVLTSSNFRRPSGYQY